MTLTTTPRRSAPQATTRAPLLVLRQCRFCAATRPDPRVTPRLRWIGDLTVRR